ncbi:DNA-directed RNA polymerase 7 kDa subunit, partial [Monkeypox virus]
NLTVQPLLDIN